MPVGPLRVSAGAATVTVDAVKPVGNGVPARITDRLQKRVACGAKIKKSRVKKLGAVAVRVPAVTVTGKKYPLMTDRCLMVFLENSTEPAMEVKTGDGTEGDRNIRSGRAAAFGFRKEPKEK